MRILRLSFKNLNSLAGEWQIDFTHPDYVSSGIFAITGPTGAGKTTILDAICLSLYGQTPRLAKITQNDNEIISRQTGECFAEVEFETAKGRFRCHWSQHRSRKRADGPLQSPKHEIVDAGSGQIIESKLTAVAKKVEEVTGMDFERFTRSMLLAQGGFAAFLQATPDKRAPILEQITGTAIYSRISIKVHECTTEQRKKLEAMRLELAGMPLLSPEDEEGLRCELTEKQRQEAALFVALTGIRDAQAWRERIALLEAETAHLEEAWLSFEVEKLAAAPDLESLSQAARAVTLEGDYAHLVALRKQQDDEQTELTSAAEMLPTAQLRLQAAVDVLAQADLELKNAQLEQQREAELIRATRALDVKIDEANFQVMGQQADCETIKRQCLDQQTSLVQNGEERQLVGRLLCEVDAFLQEYRADAGLAEALTGLEQQIKTLKLLNLHAAEGRKKLEQQGSQRICMEQALQQAENSWQGAVQSATVAEKRLGLLLAAVAALLQGRELSSWRQEAELLAARQISLTNLKDALTRMGESRQKLDTLQAKLGTLEQLRHGLDGQEKNLARECGLYEEVTRQLQDKLVLLNRVRDLEEERSLLVDGLPCPLCGAIEHPYAAGNVPPLDTAQNELGKTRSVYKEVNEQLSRVRMELVGVAKEIEQAKREHLECRDRQDFDESICAAGFTEIAVAADPSTRDAVIMIELDSCHQMLNTCRDVIREAEGLDKELSKAKSSFETAKDALNQYDKARQAAELGCQAAVSTHERLALESEALQDDLDQAIAEAGRVFEEYGYKDITPNTADGIFASLTARRNDYVQRLQEKERLEKALADLDGKKRQVQALLAAAEINLSSLEQRLAGSLMQRDNLSGQRRELFGERNPDSEERHLANVLSQAATRREEALRSQNILQNESVGLEQRIQKLTAAITTRTTHILTLEASLQLRLNDAGFADEAAFVQARLPQTRFDELTRLASTLQHNEVEIQSRRRDRATALQQELAKKLSEKTLEQLRGENSTTSAQVNDLQKALGAIEQKLQQHAELQQRQRDRLQAMEVQKKECARWEQLHALIGSSDGKKFRNFAQGLTFELMIAHANCQLRKMSDRYLLVRDGSEPLELNVIDNYQAGEVRSTRNLSGGESFIASLALSLGLSGMASRNVRVDSLFLDEGFGTLDEDALETALETLSGLQQEGKLIGIISHVPALKERIGSQIQVEAGSVGRSSLSGPGCRRIS
ncbi:MAG: chromosome segregation protein SMC [Geobacter sp.]|nr:MAG: chromosome segregation protein SMC [Geobacter sp.]